MALPRYIQKANQYIALTNQGVINQSRSTVEDNHLIFNDDQSIFIYIDQYEGDIKITIKENKRVNLFIMSYQSKTMGINFDIHIKDHALLKVYSQFVSNHHTSLDIQRSFNIEDNASLILMNHLTFKGKMDIEDKVYLRGENSNVDIDVLDIGSNRDKTSYRQMVYHKSKNSYSQIHNWMISDDESSLDYSVNGKIEKGNSKSSCQQSNKGIILSQAADIKVVPTLLIDEYDVEASHGAAIGRIDDNQLFYLLSRGLNETQAKNLIISGYINPFIHKIKNEVVEEMVKRRVHQMI